MQTKSSVCDFGFASTIAVAILLLARGACAFRPIIVARRSVKWEELKDIPVSLCVLTWRARCKLAASFLPTLDSPPSKSLERPRDRNRELLPRDHGSPRLRFTGRIKLTRFMPLGNLSTAAYCIVKQRTWYFK